MLMDYLIASVIGVAGMLGLLQLGAEVTTLHQQRVELSVAESVLRELSAQASSDGEFSYSHRKWYFLLSSFRGNV